MNKKNISIAVSLIFTAGFLWMAVQNVEVDLLKEVLARARWKWIVLAGFFCIIDMGLRGLRWRLLVSHVASAPWNLFFRLESIGIAVNNIIFMRVGEFTRAYLLGRETKIPFATAIATIALERILDLAGLLFLFCIAASIMPEVLPAGALHIGQLGLLGVLGALVFLGVAQGHWKKGPWMRFLDRSPKAVSIIDNLFLGAGSMRSLPKAAAALALSLGVWSFNAGIYFVTARSIGMGEIMSYPASLLTLSWSAVGAAIPAAPGGIGTFEALTKAILIRLGADPNEAFGFAILLHMIVLVVVTTMGLIFLWRLGLSFSSIQLAAEKKSTESEG